MNREYLNFKNVVLEAFEFLLNDFNFQCVKINTTLIRYESDRMFLQIYHGRNSFELGLEIGFLEKIKDEEQKYSLAELTEIMGLFKNPGNYIPWTVSTPELVKKYVTKLAELAKNNLQDALRGEPSILIRLSEIQTRNHNDFMAEMKLSRIIPQADECFRKKNYKNVIELLLPIRNELSPVFLKKLNYAIKHSNL